MKYAPLLIMGVFAVIFSIPNLTGDSSTVHWYNRRRVSQTDASRYAKTMGAGTLIMGASIVLTALLQMLFDREALFYLIPAGCIAGGAVMIYAQFKYNKGIF